MAGFFQELFEAYRKVDVSEVEEPEAEIEEDDVVVGVCSDELKKLYALREEISVKANELKRRLMHLMVDLAAADDDEKKSQSELLGYKQNTAMALAKLQAVNELFWACIRSEFVELADKDTVGVRRGWQVVFTEQDECPPSFGDFLKHLLG